MTRAPRPAPDAGARSGSADQRVSVPQHQPCRRRVQHQPRACNFARRRCEARRAGALRWFGERRSGGRAQVLSEAGSMTRPWRVKRSRWRGSAPSMGRMDRNRRVFTRPSITTAGNASKACFRHRSRRSVTSDRLGPSRGRCSARRGHEARKVVCFASCVCREANL
jgi:hypothetical protein